MNARKVPEEFHNYFWEYRAAELDTEKDMYLIIERLLNFGDHISLQWIWKTYTDEKIEEVVRNAKGLTDMTANFWSIAYKIPKEEMACYSRKGSGIDKPY